MGEMLVFSALSAAILVCSLFVVFARNAVACAICLVLKLFALAGMYGLIGADFLAAIQVIVYAGAIMVLFTFVIMLLNVPPEKRSRFNRPPIELMIIALCTLAFLLIAGFVASGYIIDGLPAALTRESLAAAGGNTLVVGRNLFAKYIWPFELASLLILMAIIASIVIAKKRSSEGVAE